MLGTYFYHQNIRKTIISFGNLFNNITIQHKDGDGNNYGEDDDDDVMQQETRSAPQSIKREQRQQVGWWTGPPPERYGLC